MATIDIVHHQKQKWPSGIETFTCKHQLEGERCKRQEVSLKGAIEAQLHMPVYIFLPGQMEFSLDPWRLVDEIDEHREGDSVDIWFSDSLCKTFIKTEILFRFFVGKRELAEFLEKG